MMPVALLLSASLHSWSGEAEEGEEREKEEEVRSTTETQLRSTVTRPPAWNMQLAS